MNSARQSFQGQEVAVNAPWVWVPEVELEERSTPPRNRRRSSRTISLSEVSRTSIQEVDEKPEKKVETEKDDVVHCPRDDEDMKDTPHVPDDKTDPKSVAIPTDDDGDGEEMQDTHLELRKSRIMRRWRSLMDKTQTLLRKRHGEADGVEGDEDKLKVQSILGAIEEEFQPDRDEENDKAEGDTKLGNNYESNVLNNQKLVHEEIRGREASPKITPICGELDIGKVVVHIPEDGNDTSFDLLDKLGDNSLQTFEENPKVMDVDNQSEGDEVILIIEDKLKAESANGFSNPGFSYI